MFNPAAGDLFDGSVVPSLAGALWAWLLAVAIGAALPGLRDRDDPGGSLLSWAVVGVAVQSQLWLLAGLLGLLRPAVVLGGAAALTLLAGALGGRRLVEAVRSAIAPRAGADAVDTPWLHWLSWCVLGAFLVLVTRFALWPTLFYDDLVYHVGLPRQALLTGEWPALPGFHYSYMPAGWDAMYVLPFSLGGGNGPQLMNVIALALFAWAVYRLARHGGSAAAASVVTALLVIAPVTGSLGAFAGNDLFVGLALCVAVERMLAGGGEHPVRTGLLAGAAWSAKYSALPACAGVALGTALLRRGGGGRRLAGAVTVGAVTLLVGAAWTVRSAVLTGNPIYPAFYGVLGGRYWSPESAAKVASQVSHGGLGDRGPLAFVMAIPDLLLRSDTMGYPSGLNPLYVIVGLAGLLLWRRVRGGGPLLAVLGTAYVGWCVTSLNLRYALGLLATMAPFAAALVDAGLRAGGREAAARLARLVAPLVLLLAVAGPFVGAAQRHLRLYRTSLLGDVPRHEIHATRLHLAAAGRAMAEQLPAEARVLLVAEGRVGLLPRPAVASSAYDLPEVARLARDAASVEELNRGLSGFTHVVVNYRELERFREVYGFADRFEPEGWALFERWLATGLEPVARFGNVVVYRIGAAEDRS